MAMELSLNRKKERKDMKKQAFGILTILSLVLTIAAVSVFAQSPVTVNIPFSFTVGDKSLPAGEYIAQPNRRDSRNVWSLEAKNVKASVLFGTFAVQANDTQEKTKLVFDKYGDQYFLSQVWIAGDSSGRELTKPRWERELATNGIQRETVVLTISAESGE
jgi:hypothetical protein